jgi:glyoxylase-like metal-dependent hydrolase (beta-lactamase superfamily II)
MMRVLPLGVGDAFSALYYSSCLAVEAEGAWLLVDCPHPIRKILREASQQAGLALDVGSFCAAVVTHLHADHSSGLEGFGYFAHFVLRNKATLLAHPLVLDDLWPGHLHAGMKQLIATPESEPTPMALTDYFHLRPLDEGAPVEVGPLPHRVSPDDPPHPDGGAADPGGRAVPRLQRRHRLRPIADRLAGRGGPDPA